MVNAWGTLGKICARRVVGYRALEAKVDFSELHEESWAEAGMELDRAVRAKTGAKYKWTYRGLWTA